MNNNQLNERRIAEYEDLIRQFIDKIKDLDLTGIPEPHLPVVGETYVRSRYKIAFCGMETLGWGNIEDFVKREPCDSVTASDYVIDTLEYLGYPKNYHATFWGFVLKFLSKFYNMPFEQLTSGEAKDVLKSFVWMNANSIERYSTSAEKDGADQGSWQKVKEASLPFDNLNHMLRVASPKVVFILSSSVRENYYLDLNSMGLQVDNSKDYLRITNEGLNYQYFYRRDTETHIFYLPHPTYVGAYSGRSIDEYVDSVIADLKNYGVWERFPEENTPLFDNGDDVDMDSMDFKRMFIADLAKTLVRNNCVMSGQELQHILRRNNIHTSYGCEYGTDGGRGIHKTISTVWTYYHDAGDYQTAYFIARAFVKQDGSYAY